MTIRIMCAWCQADLGTKAAPRSAPGAITHGICVACIEKMEAES